MFSIFKRDESRLCIKCKHYDGAYCARKSAAINSLEEGRSTIRMPLVPIIERGMGICKCGPSGRFYEEAK